MRCFGVIRNNELEAARGKALEICEYLGAKGIECILSVDGSDLPQRCEAAIVLGGDGTLLRASKALNQKEIPLLGVNLGNLGYLAEIETSHIYPALDKLIEHDYGIELRMMLYGTVYHDGKKIYSDIALNDIALTRVGSLRTLAFQNFVNSEYLNTYSADGEIVCTPTGSTGYSLSAGGPIVSPSAEMIMLTPVSPHSLISRSIIFSGSDTIRVEIAAGRTGYEKEAASVSFDGNIGVRLATGDSVLIRKSLTYAKIIKINNVSFLEVLRRKMAGT